MRVFLSWNVLLVWRQIYQNAIKGRSRSAPDAVIFRGGNLDHMLRNSSKFSIRWW